MSNCPSLWPETILIFSENKLNRRSHLQQDHLVHDLGHNRLQDTYLNPSVVRNLVQRTRLGTGTIFISDHCVGGFPSSSAL